MLVLSRKTGESLRIGSDVRVTIVAASPGHVRIGIEAPDDVAIYREEVFGRIAEANLEASKAPARDERPLAPRPLGSRAKGKVEGS